MVRTVDPDRYEEKRNFIIKQAKHCFLSKGINATSIAMICKAANTGAGNLYHYFPNKEAILEAIIDDYLSQLTLIVEGVLENSSPQQVLEEYFEHVESTITEQGPNFVVDLLVESTRNPKLAKLSQLHSKKILKLLSTMLLRMKEKQLIADDIDVEISSSLILSLTDGTKLLKLRTPEIDISRLYMQVKEVIYNHLNFNC